MDHHVICLNLSTTDIQKLKSAGYNYCSDLKTSVLNSQQIELPQAPLTKSALLSLEEELKDRFVLSYSGDLDQVLRDEITPKRITELTGLPGTGKSQISQELYTKVQQILQSNSFQLCVTVQLPNIYGGLEGEAVYISTNNNLASHRIRQIAEQFFTQVKDLVLNSEDNDKFSVETIMKHIYVFKCDDFIDLLASIKYLEEFLKDKKVYFPQKLKVITYQFFQVKLIVIDSISNPIRGLCQEERTNILQSVLSDLQFLSSIFNFAVIYLLVIEVFV